MFARTRMKFIKLYICFPNT